MWWPRVVLLLSLSFSLGTSFYRGGEYRGPCCTSTITISHPCPVGHRTWLDITFDKDIVHNSYVTVPPTLTLLEDCGPNISVSIPSTGRHVTELQSTWRTFQSLGRGTAHPFSHPQLCLAILMADGMFKTQRKRKLKEWMEETYSDVRFLMSNFVHKSIMQLQLVVLTNVLLIINGGGWVTSKNTGVNHEDNGDSKST